MNETVPVICSGSFPSKAVQITIYSLLMASSLIGNFLVVGVFYRNKTLRAAVHYFIMNMAISDLIYPVVYLPYRLSTSYFGNVWLIQGFAGDVLCKLTWNAGNLSNGVSTFSMIVISVDRFHGVVFPMKPPLLSRTKCRFVIVCVWLAAIAFCSPFFYLVKLVPDDNKLLRCVFNPWLASHEMTLFKAILIFHICFMFVNALVLTLLYSSVAVRLYRQKYQFNLATEQIRRRNKMNCRITWMLLIVVILYYFVWTQFFSVKTLFLLKDNVMLPCIYTWSSKGAILPLYTAVNPVVYYIYNDKYRQGFKDLLCFCYPSKAITVQNKRRADNASHTNDAIEFEQR